MKKWPLVVAALYALIFLILFNSLVWFTLADKKPRLSQIVEPFFAWQMWALAAVMGLAQFALLRIPVAVASARPISKRPLLTTVITAALMMGLLFLGAAASIFEFSTKPGGKDFPWLVVVIALASWVFWAFWFHRSTKRRPEDGKLRPVTRCLWAGSILELLIAIPTHILVRQRNYCCAGILTFVGLVCGMSVMLFAFGPAVYFLFVERWKRLQPRDAH